jgi:hypothetical protein
MHAKRAGQGENADEAAGEVGRLAGEQDVAHDRGGEVEKAGPDGGAENVQRGVGKQQGGEGGVGEGDGGAAQQEQRQDEAELGFDGGQADEQAAQTRAAAQEQQAAADQGGEQSGVLVFQEVFETGRAGGDGGDQPKTLAGEAEHGGEQQQAAKIESQNRVPGGEPAEAGGEQQVVRRVAPQVIGQLAVGAGEETLVGERVEQHGDVAVQGKKTAGPEIQAVAQGLAGQAVQLAPSDGVGLGAGRQGAQDHQSDELGPGENLTSEAHMRNIPCFPFLKAHS